MTRAGTLSGKRVLVVEDEYLIAHDIKRALSELNAEVVGPVSNLAAALALADDNGLDAAVLDINLCGHMSYELADRLKAEGVPHMFVTGYDDWALPESHAGTPRVAKPFTSQAVTAMVEFLCERPPA